MVMTINQKQFRKINRCLVITGLINKIKLLIDGKEVEFLIRDWGTVASNPSSINMMLEAQYKIYFYNG